MMDFLLKSGFEVLHPSSSQLVVVAHPLYWIALIPLVILAVGLYCGILGVKKRNVANIGLGAFLLVLCTFVLSWTTAHGRAVFDKQAGTVTFDRVGTLFISKHLTFPLDQVRGASVQPMGGGSYHFIVSFKGGGIEDLTGSTGATGQYRAAEAVNEFLRTGH